jgi:anhydro-N-acetylmuramic acid kinase
MSGTSLDGVDGVLASFSNEDHKPIRTLADAYIPFSAELRAALMALQSPGENEIHREALAANDIAQCYASCVDMLLDKAGISAQDVAAVGSHGQTIRHRPELGYTRQTNNPALLAELTGISIIADFRSRDIAAGGQGAPLVPAFHRAVFESPTETRVVANIGGIANISVLDHGTVAGFDTGPGNVLMDLWIGRHRGQAYDAGGAWAATGKVHEGLLQALCAEPYFASPPPKSTGRDLFNARWLDHKLSAFPALAQEDTQATLTAYTARTLAKAIAEYARDAAEVFVCGGGAYNPLLLQLLQKELAQAGCTCKVATTDRLDVPPNHVEALAFAWLAHRHIMKRAGNLPAVTGAAGERILGALYPA